MLYSTSLTKPGTIWTGWGTVSGEVEEGPDVLME
jgi:hypothetical protein